MEKKVKKGRGLRVFIALGVMCMLLMGLAVQAGAADSEPASGNLTMTLTVTENGKQVPMAQVPLALYQVGTMDTQPVVQFHLDPSLSATGVDLNNLGQQQIPRRLQQLCPRLWLRRGWFPIRHPQMPMAR